VSLPISLPRGLRAFVVALGIFAAAFAPAYAFIPSNISVTETTTVAGAPGPGFGNDNNGINSYAWSMAWFNGKLYVGTVRDERCLEDVTYAFYKGMSVYKTNPQPNVTCPADPYTMDLRAEIWQYDPATSIWTKVYTSPTVVNPRETSQQIALDIGYRNMVVYTDPNTGQQALYVLGVSADEFIPELLPAHGPRILYTTDGSNWNVVNPPASPLQVTVDNGSGSGVQTVTAIGYRAAAVYGGKLFVTATTGLTGAGPMVEIDNPMGATPTYTQVTPPSIDPYELENFNGMLYVGAGSFSTGYSVWYTDGTASSTAPYLNFTQVVGGGAGRGKNITSVVSMHVLGNYLYVGSSGWFTTLFPASEMIRIANDNSTWQLVVGNSRIVNGVTVSPISGLPDGFGNWFNAHFWRMQDFEGGLIVGTNDWSYLLQGTGALATATQSQWGFDIYGSCDGQFWYLGTRNAFGDGQYNFGARTMVTSPDNQNLYIGSANHVQGANVWRLTNTTGAPLCPSGAAPAEVAPVVSSNAGSNTASTAAPLGSSTTAAPLLSSTTGSATVSSAAPGGLEADQESCATILSWAPVPGAVQYRILRAEYQPVTMSVSKPPSLGSPVVPDQPWSGPGGTTMTGQVPVAGPAHQIGAGNNTYFIDHSAKQGAQYAYLVEAIDGNGNASNAAFAFAPSQAAPASFGTVMSSIATQQGKMRDHGASLTALVSQAQQAAASGNVAGAVQALHAASAQLRNPGPNMNAVTAQQLLLPVSELERQVSLASVRCDGGAGVGVHGNH
jgi:hypothetical protein